MIARVEYTVSPLWDGVGAYTHIRYADDENGTNMVIPTIGASEQATTPTPDAPVYPTCVEAYGQSLYGLPDSVHDEITADGWLIKRVGVLNLADIKPCVLLADNNVRNPDLGSIIIGCSCLEDVPSSKPEHLQAVGIMSSHFISMNGFYPYRTVENLSLYIDKSACLVGAILKSRLSAVTTAALRDWVQAQSDAETPVMVYYEMETPVKTKITAIADKSYIGIAVTDSEIAPTAPSEYSWSKYVGTGISSVTIEYAIGGTTAPTSGWSTTPPTTWGDTEYLWTRNKITYTDSTVAYAGTNRLSDVEAERALEKAKDYTDAVKISEVNILKGSGVPVANSNYLVNSYNLALAPNVDDDCVLILKGQLGEGKNYFQAYNSSGHVLLGNLASIGSGLYALKFKWRKTWGEYVADDSHLRVYSSPNTVVAENAIEWIKLVRGQKTSLDWTPAPEDVQQQITTNATNITNQGIQISQITTTVNGHGTQIGTLQTNVSELTADGLLIEETLATGGVNLLANPTFGSKEVPDAGKWHSNFTVGLIRARFAYLTMAQVKVIMSTMTMNEFKAYNW